ncbi:MAG: galactosyltransferase-related protein [archaeon]|nr:galactosyltransferase-related protein [archaeon]
MLGRRHGKQRWKHMCLSLASCLGMITFLVLAAGLALLFLRPSSVSSPSSAVPPSARHPRGASRGAEEAQVAFRKHLHSFTHFLMSLNDLHKISQQHWAAAKEQCLRDTSAELLRSLTALDDLLADAILEDLRAFVTTVATTEDPAALLLTETKRPLRGSRWARGRSPLESLQEAYRLLRHAYRGQFCMTPQPAADKQFAAEFLSFSTSQLSLPASAQQQLSRSTIWAVNYLSAVERGRARPRFIQSMFEMLLLLRDLDQRIALHARLTTLLDPPLQQEDDEQVMELISVASRLLVQCASQPNSPRDPSALISNFSSNLLQAASSASDVPSLAIIVPLRDREAHLAEFVQHALATFSRPPQSESYARFKVFVIEQSPGEAFNRGKLMNIGAVLADAEGFSHLLFHDVDMIGLSVSYSPSQLTLETADEIDFAQSSLPPPLHLATCVEQFDWSLPYAEYFGGVSLFQRHSFFFINGFSNRFWGWGHEDDDLYLRILSHWPSGPVRGLPVCSHGKFHSLGHAPNRLVPDLDHKDSDGSDPTESLECRSVVNHLFPNILPNLDGISSLVYDIVDKSSLHPLGLVVRYVVDI